LFENVRFTRRLLFVCHSPPRVRVLRSAKTVRVQRAVHDGSVRVAVPRLGRFRMAVVHSGTRVSSRAAVRADTSDAGRQRNTENADNTLSRFRPT